jgi:ADP-ribosylglycohydrolase
MKSPQSSPAGITRRTLLQRSALGVLGAGVLNRLTESAAAPSEPGLGLVPLREKFYGCIAACHLGSSMGAAVEGWDYARIEAQYGTLDRLLPYEHYGNGWKREPGTTEDGVERQKLIITAILEKQDRVTAEDVRRAWVEHMNPKAAGLVSEPFEGALLAMAKTPMPASDIGKYCDYAGLVSMARSCHPIGLINAGDIDGAINDVHDVGQLYNTASSRGLRWAEVTAVGIAAATRPGATVDSVLGAILDNCDRSSKRYGKEVGARREIERALKLTAECRDFRQMRLKFDSLYSGQGIPYAQSYANEVVTKAVCILRMVQGNTWEAIKAAVNMGRDTDCLAAVAGGLTGSLSGAAPIPAALLEQVDKATRLNPHTNSQRTLRETSDGLYGAYQARLKRLQSWIRDMERA